MNLANEVKSLRRLVGDMERRLKVAERPPHQGRSSPLADLLERCASGKGRVLPPPENPYGQGSELFSQWVPRNIGGGDGGVGAGGAAGTEYDADETYLAEDEGVEPHVFSHKVIAAQPVPTTGSDIVRSGTGHIQVTPVEHQVNPAGHIDTSKTGAIASHGAPDQDAEKNAVGDKNVTTVVPYATSATVDGTKGLALTELTRIALDPAESGGPTLRAFFRTVSDDHKGHVSGVGVEQGESEQLGYAVYKPPWGTAENQMWRWDNTAKAYVAIAAPTADFQVLQRKADDSIGWDYPRVHA